MTRIPLKRMEKRLAAAGNADAVVAIMQECLESWSRDELAKLPENCRPDAVHAARDIQWYADVFAMECRSGELIGFELQEMCDLFRLAARRIRELGPAGVARSAGA